MSVYQARDIAYDRIEAIRGRIYQVVIKKVITSTEEYLNGSEDFYTYVDTLNSVHLEENLIDYETAAKLTGVIYFSGGVVCSGVTSCGLVYYFVASGGINSSGNAVSWFTYNNIASGGTICSGVADNDLISPELSFLSDNYTEGEVGLTSHIWELTYYETNIGTFNLQLTWDTGGGTASNLDFQIAQEDLLLALNSAWGTGQIFPYSYISTSGGITTIHLDLDSTFITPGATHIATIN